MCRRWVIGGVGAVVAVLVAVGFGGAARAASRSFHAPGATVLPGGPTFPIVLSPGPPLGSRTPWGTDALDETAAAGVNMFRVGPGGIWTSDDLASVLAWDRAARAHHVYTWVNLSGYAQALPGSTTDSSLAQVVATLTQDPSDSAIGMWRGRDEPWWSDMAPSTLQFAYCRVTSRGDPSWCGGEPSLDPQPLWVTIEAPRGAASDLAPYAAVTDVHGVDIYPVTLGNPSPDLHQVGSWTATIASISPAAPVWTTLQICASGSYDRSTGAFVLPTLQQERYMAYDAIINGAQMLAFYGGDRPGCWSASDAQYGWNWAFWQSVLKPLVQELSSSAPIAPALLDLATSTAVTTSDPTTEAVLRQGTSADDLWLIAARSGPGNAEVTFSGLPQWAGTGSVYTEDRSVSASAGSISDSFDQWDVHVYHFVEPLSLQGEQPAGARVGARVTLRGQGLAAATTVRFAGAEAPFVIESDDELVASVPRQARSGAIVVTSALGQVEGASRFTVLPSLARRPRIIGAARVGRVLRATSGRWYGDRPTGHRFTWLRCNSLGRSCNRARAATHRTLRLEPRWVGSRMRVLVVANTPSGSARATSAPTPIVTW